MATSNTLWLLDIGNSRVSLARREGRALKEVGCFGEDESQKIAKKLGSGGGSIQKTVLISSVVPKIESKIRGKLGRLGHRKVYSFGKDIPIPIRSKYQTPKKLGIDRQLNVYGALKRIKPPFLIFDFGTATTLDYVSGKGVFEGGLIFLGMEASLQALSERGAQLPKVALKGTSQWVGRDTRNGMIIGALRGHAAMVEGLTMRYRKRFGSKLKTIATGGMADIISRYCPSFDLKDRLLMFRSMAWLYDEWMNQKSNAEERR